MKMEKDSQQLMRIKCTPPREGRVKFNIQHFQDIGTSELYQVTLHNRFHALQDLQNQEPPSSVEDRWTSLKTIWKDTCKEVVGRRKVNSKPWRSMETFKKVGKRRDKKELLNRSKTRATKAIAQKEYEAANKEVKKSVEGTKRSLLSI